MEESPTKGQIHHIEIVVLDLKKSSEFYGNLFAWLGYRKILDEKEEAGWSLENCSIYLSKCKDRFVQHGYHRKRVGLNHVAFVADSKELVDTFYKDFLLPKKVPVLYGGPKERPEYVRGYYSVYFEDPDRLKLELAYVPR